MFKNIIDFENKIFAKENIDKNIVQSIHLLYVDFLKGGWFYEDTKELLRLLEDLRAECKTEQTKAVIELHITKVRKHLKALKSDKVSMVVEMFEGIVVTLSEDTIEATNSLDRKQKMLF